MIPGCIFDAEEPAKQKVVFPAAPLKAALNGSPADPLADFLINFANTEIA